MMRLVPLVLAALLASVPVPAGAAVPVALDHVILAVRDLEPASAACEKLGFRIKRGRLHANGLLNRHIKFANGSSLELMTVRATPADGMARDYATLIRERDGGAYVALRAADLAAVLHAAKSAGLAPRETRSGSWRFVSFPPRSDAGAVFFTSGVPPVRDPDSLTSHPNGARELAEAWVEGGPRLEALLAALGARRGRDVAVRGRGTGHRWILGRESVLILPRGARRPRPVAVGLRRDPGHGGRAESLVLPGGVTLLLQSAR